MDSVQQQIRAAPADADLPFDGKRFRLCVCARAARVLLLAGPAWHEMPWYLQVSIVPDMARYAYSSPWHCVLSAWHADCIDLWSGVQFKWHEICVSMAQLDVVAAWHVILLAEAFCIYWLLSYLWLWSLHAPFPTSHMLLLLLFCLHAYSPVAEARPLRCERAPWKCLFDARVMCIIYVIHISCAKLWQPGMPFCWRKHCAYVDFCHSFDCDLITNKAIYFSVSKLSW